MLQIIAATFLTSLPRVTGQLCCIHNGLYWATVALGCSVWTAGVIGRESESASSPSRMVCAFRAPHSAFKYIETLQDRWWKNPVSSQQQGEGCSWWWHTLAMETPKPLQYGSKVLTLSWGGFSDLLMSFQKYHGKTFCFYTSQVTKEKNIMTILDSKESKVNTSKSDRMSFEEITTCRDEIWSEWLLMPFTLCSRSTCKWSFVHSLLFFVVTLKASQKHSNPHCDPFWKYTLLIRL